MAGKTRTALFTERVELLPVSGTPTQPSEEHIAAFQKKFEIKDRDLAVQLLYALDASTGADERVQDLEQLAKNISAAGNEESKLAVLFRLLDVERSGVISAAAVDQQLKKVCPSILSLSRVCMLACGTAVWAAHCALLNSMISH